MKKTYKTRNAFKSVFISLFCFLEVMKCAVQNPTLCFTNKDITVDDLDFVVAIQYMLSKCIDSKNFKNLIIQERYFISIIIVIKSCLR